jgi:hypothetical protein
MHDLLIKPRPLIRPLATIKVHDSTYTPSMRLGTRSQIDRRDVALLSPRLRWLHEARQHGRSGEAAGPQTWYD